MNLREIRTNKNLSQEQLATLSGLNVRTIQRLEKGSAPSIESLKCLAAALNVEVSDITGDLEKPAERSKKSSGSICFLLLFVASVFVLFGAKSEVSSPEIAVFFYICAAVCFILTSSIMFKNRLGDTF